MENKTLFIAVALLLVGLAVIYFASDVNNRNGTNSNNAFEHSEAEK